MLFRYQTILLSMLRVKLLFFNIKNNIKMVLMCFCSKKTKIKKNNIKINDLVYLKIKKLTRITDKNAI
jgi:hypothetical protein